MNLDKKVTRLLDDHGLAAIIDQLVRQAGLPKVLLQISNQLVLRGQGKDKANNKKWIKRAKAVHVVMEEIESEINPNA